MVYSGRRVFRANKILSVFALHIFEVFLLTYRNKHNNTACSNKRPNSDSTRSNDALYPVHRLTVYENCFTWERN